jgi:hypothetical protein
MPAGTPYALCGRSLAVLRMQAPDEPIEESVADEHVAPEVAAAAHLLRVDPAPLDAGGGTTIAGT